MLKHVVDLSSPFSVLESRKVAPLSVLSPTQDKVYEGVGDPTIFFPMRATRTCLPTCHHTTVMGLLPICPPILSSQIAIVNTPTCVLHLALQDVKFNSYLSVVTDNILDTRALLENVSLINQINCLDPIPDPGTRNNDLNLQSLRAICPLSHIIRWTFNLPQLLLALTGYQ